MKEKLKYNFLLIIPLQYSKFYTCFLPVHVQGRDFFCNTECLTGAPESNLLGGKI